jgi:hypothetical protein
MKRRPGVVSSRVAISLLAMGLACGTSKQSEAPPPAERSGSGVSAPAPAASAVAPEVVLDPAPPRGVVVPVGVIVVEAVSGEAIRAAYVWKGTFRVDRGDAGVQERMTRAKARSPGPISPREAVLELYADAVRAAGREVTTFAFAAGFDYETGEHAVFVRVPEGADPDTFEITATIPGG